MPNIPSPFGGAEPEFDDPEAFVPEHLPEPGPFLAEHDVLEGERHVTVHRLANDLFEERGVYDMTFGYNLARLNRDPRHESAGFRYAEADVGSDEDESGCEDTAASETQRILRAEFTPTTPFCPQSHTLTTGSFRAWNAEPERHDYDLVAIRVAPMHHESEAINAELADLEGTFRDAGPSAIVAATTADDPTGADDGPAPPGTGRAIDRLDGDSAPF